MGQTLEVTPGTWTGNPTPVLSYQWLRCDAAGATCGNIAGATATTYTLVADDQGSTIRVAETATNDGGSATATSDQTAVIDAALAAPPSPAPDA